MSVVVVTDSSACLDPDVARAAGIEVVPLHVITDETGRATTSRPTIGELVETYTCASSRGEVLALHLPRQLSGTIDNALLAAEQLAQQGQRVEVADLGVTAAPLGLAALAASAHDDTDSALMHARELAAGSALFFMVDDIRYMGASGRLDPSMAKLASVVGVRPILTLTRGRIGLKELSRGRMKARRRMVACAVERATQLYAPGSHVTVTIHGQVGDGVDNQLYEVADLLQEEMGRAGFTLATTSMSGIDPALAVHLGPGTVGVALTAADSGMS